MKSFLSTIFFLTIFSFIIPSKSFANVSCQPIYGGGQTCVTAGDILLNKKVLNPANNTFVDNLGINDSRYAPEFLVNFRLDITNSGDTNIAKVEVKDIFPQYVEFSSGPGTFDSKTKTLTFSLDSLAPNETKTFGLIGKVVSLNQLPANQGVVCVVNQAKATTNEGLMSSDNSQFCIEKKVAPTLVPVTKGGFPVVSPVPVYTTPPTGPESLALFSLIPAGITGFILRKFSFKNRKEQN